MRHFRRVFLTLTLLLPAQLWASPIFLNPSNGFPTGEHPHEWLAKRTVEVREQKWLRVRLNSKSVGWTSDDTVLTRTNLLGRAFVLNPAIIFSEPRIRSEALRTVEPGEYLNLLGDVESYVKVSSAEGEIGFIEKAKLITSRNLGEKEAVVIRDSTILRSAPTPDSHEIIRVEKLNRLQITETSTLKWGRVEIPDKGTAWWPLDEETSPPLKTNSQKFSSSELFERRKIFDIASSPLVPNLRFASAKGIFRSLDDKTWEKIPKFGDQNYPIAISKSGRLFIGFWYSDDEGETFRSFVRFDQLLSSLKTRWQLNPHRFKFVEVRPVNSTGTELIVKVDIGLNKPVEALSHDQGITWKAL